MSLSLGNDVGKAKSLILRAREDREKEEVVLEHRRRRLELEERYAQQLTELRKEKEAVDEQLRQQVGRTRSAGRGERMCKAKPATWGHWGSSSKWAVSGVWEE
eukprot:365022-Chlamydomonas_euryale.AAC.1